MPELPEVEFAARTLRTWLLGHRIVRAEVAPTRVVRGQTPSRIKESLEGHRVLGIERRAKYLLFELDHGVGAISHLGMTGKWLRRKPEDPPSHSRLRFFLDDGSVVHYRDPRMFGHFEVRPAAELRAAPAIAALGPDPLADGLTAAQLGAAIAKTTRPIKVALLDQSVVAGLGNIQAAEALYRAHLHPARKGKSLSGEEVRRLVSAIHASIAHTLKGQADPTEITYVEEGGDNPFLVYGRKGESCRRCGTPFATIVQAGRTTWFCPGCQPRKAVLRAKPGSRRTR